MKLSVLLTLSLAVAGCATPVAPPVPDGLFQDAQFGPPSAPVGAGDLYALSPAMTHFVDTVLAHRVRSEGASQALIHALYRRDQLRLDYDATQTRNAAQAFEARQGNCLSLVIMTAAFAKALGLQVTYQSVAIGESWSRSDNLAFLNGHVNLTIGPRRIDARPGYDANAAMTIDFLPAPERGAPRTQPLTEDTVRAMYMNNRSAEAMARGQLDDAYWWARGAIVQDPGFINAYNTLSVVYLRHGDALQAQHVLKMALEREADNRLVLSNLVLALEANGQGERAAELRQRLAALESAAPYRDLLLGMAALQRGEPGAAKALFTREITRSADCSECHFWLGLADYRLGDLDEARAHLEIAAQSSSTGAEHALYEAKLAWLRNLHSQ